MSLTTRGKLVVALTIVVTLLGVPAIAGALYLRSIGVFGSSDPGRRVEVVIPEGASTSEIGELLATAGVIRSALGWRIRLYMDGSEENIQSGVYRLPTGLNARDALDALLKGPLRPEFVDVTFPEGSWLVDFAAILEREVGVSSDEFVELTTTGRVRSKLQPADVETLEGLLFPSTYEVDVDDVTARSMARRLADEMIERVEALDLSRVRALGYTPYEALIIASMIEAESRIDSERPKVAAVIYNRLEVGMTLGIDATVLYALGEHKSELTTEDLQIDSPYNTRLYAGLPPTPIGAPGEAALEAAAHPAQGDWIYYVLADCEGNHAFSESYDEFLADKAAYQQLDC